MFNRSLTPISRKLQTLLDNTGDMALHRRAGIIIESLNLKKGDKVLDAGCGDGYYLHLLSQIGIPLKLIGADNDPNALKSAKRNLASRGIRLEEIDLMKKLPFPDNYFDKVILSEVLEHLPSDSKGLKEIKRVMKKGGILVLSVPNANYPFLWDPVNWTLEKVFDFHLQSGFLAGIWNQHLRLYSEDKLRQIIKQNMMNILTVHYTTFWCIPFNHYLLNLAARRLHSGEMDEGLKESLNKFSSPRKTFSIRMIFEILKAVDFLNNFYSGRSSVSIVVVTQK